MQWAERRCNRAAGHNRAWYDRCYRRIPEPPIHAPYHTQDRPRSNYTLQATCSTPYAGLTELFCLNYNDADGDHHILCLSLKQYKELIGRDLDWSEIMTRGDTLGHVPGLNDPKVPLQRGLTRDNAFKNPESARGFAVRVLADFGRAAITAALVLYSAAKVVLAHVEVVGKVLKHGVNQDVCLPESPTSPWDGFKKVLKGDDLLTGICSAPENSGLTSLYMNDVITFEPRMSSSIDFDNAALVYSIIGV